MTNETQGTWERGADFIEYTPERNIFIDYIFYDDKEKSAGFFTLDVKDVGSERLLLGSVGLDSFPALVARISQYLIDHALSSVRKEQHNLRVSPIASNKLSSQENDALERIVRGYREKWHYSR